MEQPNKRKESHNSGTETNEKKRQRIDEIKSALVERGITTPLYMLCLKYLIRF